MSTDTPPWWERFFDGDNRLRWSALRNYEGPWAANVLPWVETAQHDDVDLPIILPRLDADDQPSWYCAGRSPQGAQRLREALQAFIGPSYSDFDGRPYPLNLNDPVEAAFAETTVEPIYRIRPARPEEVPKIRRALELYRGLLHRIPKAHQQPQRAIGALRAELDRALAAGDEVGARNLLERIRSIGRLDAENLLFLEVAVRARLGLWREIAEDGALLGQLTGLRLPPRVLADVHEAMYRLHIEPNEDPDDPSRALEAFRAAGLGRRSPLFSTRRGLRSPRVLKAFFLYELAREEADQTLLADLARELEELDDAFAHALARLGRATPSQPEADPIRAADEAFDNLEIDRALELYLLIPPSRTRLIKLIRCVEDVGTAEAAKRVLDTIKPGDNAENLPASWTKRLRQLEDLCATAQDSHVPQGWLDWARGVDAGMSEQDAMSTLREHMATWDSSTIVRDQETTAELTRIINNASGSADSIFREATPLLYHALMPESGSPPRQLKPLLQIFVTKVALLADPSQNELDLARDLTSTLLLMGLDETEYSSLVSDLEDLMGAQISVFTLGWSLDLVELLSTHVCPAPEPRLRLAMRVLDQAGRMSHRLSPTDTLVIKELCQDLGLDCSNEIIQEDEVQASEASEDLAGKKVGIYTLVEPAGQRAAALLEHLCPSVRVEVNSDHECTQRLINLARSADVFIFAWKSSKHQAFYCVKDHRDGTHPLIQAQGKGTSSILRAVLEGK